MLSAGRKLTGCSAVLCLPARPSRLGLHESSRTLRRGHVFVVNMDQKQPNVVNVRNGPSRGRSRSVSRRSRSVSRSRSRTRDRSRSRRGDRPRPTAARARQSEHFHVSTWTRTPRAGDGKPTHGEDIAGKLDLRRYAEQSFSVRDMKAVVHDPKTDEALTKLLEKCVPELDGDGGKWYTVRLLAQEVGPETIPAAHLASILDKARVARLAPMDAWIKEKADFDLQHWQTTGRKLTVTLGELPNSIRFPLDMCRSSTHEELMRLAEKVGNKHGDIGLDTPIDVTILAAETGPDTMTWPVLLGLLRGLPGGYYF